MSEAIQLWPPGGSGARFSTCGSYRYELTRRWARGPYATFIMLNPSTADAVKDDPTIRKCRGFAERWGMGGLVVVNLFALQATNPTVLEQVKFDPVGPENDDAIHDVVVRSRVVVAAWGVQGGKRAQTRAIAVREYVHSWWGGRLHCLGRTNDGSPRHPLRLPYDTKLELL